MTITSVNLINMDNALIRSLVNNSKKKKSHQGVSAISFLFIYMFLMHFRLRYEWLEIHDIHNCLLVETLV